ncbi:MAG: sigma-70 family RNA polymerase sigma factor [Gemmatimonadales bacterium]
MNDLITELFRQYHPSVLRMLIRRTGDPDRAEDLAAEVFARAFAAPPQNPRPWLFAVALNLVREDARRASRHGRRLQLLKAETPESTETPADAYDRVERAAGVRAALDRLSERDREVLLLQAEGFDYDEIAATSGLARGAVGTTLARARKRLVLAYHAEQEAGIRATR